MALTDQLTAIGNAIRAKTGGSALIPLNDMPSEIANIPGGGVPASALVITGDCQYRFANNAWNWFISDYGNDITTSNITDCSYIVYNTNIAIPFTLNVNSNTYIYTFADYKGTTTPAITNTYSGSSNYNFNYMFYQCESTQVGILTGFSNAKINNMSAMFLEATKLTSLPTSFLEGLDYSIIHSATTDTFGAAFSGMNDLRSISKNIVKQIYNNSTSASGMALKSLFQNCYALREIDGINSSDTALTRNLFTNTFVNLCHVNRIRFLVDENNNNTPFTKNWKSQVIDLTKYVGYSNGGTNGYIESKTTLPAEKEVTDATSYNLLKNDPDWWTSDIYYSRYNHDSAVETINSLPDISSAGGTNTINFKGNSGRDTDGGAINVLTSAEIAVATAKGWTVTLA